MFGYHRFIRHRELEASDGPMNGTVFSAIKGKRLRASYGRSDTGHEKKVRVDKCYTPDKSIHHMSGFDLALCKLTQKFEIDRKTAWPICLPKDGDQDPAAGEVCEISGWGFYTDDNGTKVDRMSDHLRGKKVKIKGPAYNGTYILFEAFGCYVSFLIKILVSILELIPALNHTLKPC